MKVTIFILSICSLLGIDFNIAPGITWADVGWVSILIISIVKYLNHSWKFDYFAKCSMIFIPCMLLSALVNMELANTIFINFFRNYTAGIVVYFALSNVLESKKDIKTFLIFGILFLIQFMMNYQRMMQDTFSENMATLDFGYGRNNVAFTALLFAILFEFLYYSKIAKAYILLGIAAMFMIITLCASRYAMMMLAISFLLYRFVSNKKLSMSEAFSIALLVLVAPRVMSFLSGFVDSSFLSFSQDYLKEKMSNADDDFYNTRIIEINALPISNYYQDQGILGLIFGNGISIQHSFFSHALITTGIIGLYFFVKSSINLMKWSFKFRDEGFFLFVVIVAMYLNDFITNARFIVGVNSIFYCIICAIIYSHIKLQNELDEYNFFS